MCYFLLLGLAVEVHVALLGELYNAWLHGEDGVIFAETGVGSCEDAGAALAYDNRADACRFAGIKLDAEVLRIGVSEVFRCTCAFFGCHGFVLD